MTTTTETTADRICPPRQALDLIGDRWTMIVVKALFEGNQRYGALHRAIDGISQKMLTQTLRSLDRDGLVRRTVYPVVPPKVDYALTPLGDTLFDLLMAIGTWAEEHMASVEEARATHDAAAERSRSEADRAYALSAVGGS
jgi:DNA-binding HxlR family transcriptional regulator